MKIRPARPGDSTAIWRILDPMIRAGESYALPRDMAKADALAYWTGPDREAFVAEQDGRLLGTYYLRANQAGGGAHVANCGYVTAPDAGVAASPVSWPSIRSTASAPRRRSTRAGPPIATTSAPSTPPESTG